MPRLRKFPALAHAMISSDTIAGEFCSTLSLGDTFGDLAQCEGVPFHAFGATTAGVLKALVNGAGAVTFSRFSAPTVTDFEGLVKTTLANELRFEYGRRIQNVCDPSDDLTDVAWLKQGSTLPVVTKDQTVGGVVADQVDFGPTSFSRLSLVAFAASSDKDIVFSFWAVVASGTEDIRVNIRDTESGDQFTTLTITTTPKRFSVQETAGALSEAYCELRNSDSSARTVYFYDEQIEDVTGQANQNPGEYVSVGLLSYDYHGVGVDGVKYFDYENGNTVSSNTVTEAKGSDLTTEWYALFEPPAINYADGDNDLSGGAETVDLTAGGAGDFTLSVYGTVAVTVAAGTATGTGFGQATEGNPVTFNLSITGTVTLTLDSGALNKTDGLAQKQIEKAAVASSWIPTSGGSATRSVDDGTPFAQVAGNVDETKGMLIFDLNSSVAAADLPATTAIVSLADAANSLFRLEAAADELKSFDGTNTASDSLAFAKDNWYRFAVRWNADDSEFQVGYKDVTGAGSWQWGTAATFDGAFEVGTAINMFFSGPSAPQRIKNLLIYSSDQGTSWIEANF